jgi:hypothetical protein
MNWTFAGATFWWVRRGNTLDLASWNRPVRLTEREIFGTGETEFNTTGHGAYRISGQITIEDTAHLELLENARGSSGTLSDGTRTCTAVLSAFELTVQGPGYDSGSPYTARATFALPQPQDYTTLPRP